MSEDDASGRETLRVVVVELAVNDPPLPPPDRGLGAYSFLAAAFVVEGIVWGFPYAFGAFLDDYLQDSYYTSQPNASSLLPLIGPLSSGIMYCSAPFINLLSARFPQHRRKSLWIGAVVCWASLLGASYAKTVTHLIALEGVVFAIGGSVLYAQCISFISEWFLVRRGLANGVFFAGTAVAGLVLPLVIPRLIGLYGAPVALRILAIASAILLFPVLPFVKGRLRDVPPAYIRPSNGPKLLVLDVNFLIVVLVNTIQGFGFFVPMLWLPTFATDAGYGSNSSLSLALLNGASGFGQLVIGYLSDRVDPWLLAITNLILSSLSAFVLWGVFSNTLPGLLGFGIVFGVIAGGWSSLWAAFARIVAKDDPAVATTLFGFLLFTRGLGNICSTPISTLLLGSEIFSHDSKRESTGFKVGGGRFESMILYTGACFGAASVLAIFGWATYIRKRRKADEAAHR